jgi:signal peptidase I
MEFEGHTDPKAAELVSDPGTEGSSDPGKPARPPRRTVARGLNRWLVEWAIILALVVGFTFVLRAYVVETFIIPSGSMEPTLMVGDRITVDKLAYDFHSVHRGDVIVFRRPPDEDCGGPPVPDLVKRVIGLPGETIWSKGNTIYIATKSDPGGHPLGQPWFKPVPLGPPIVKQTIAANHYFVMGDNRSESCDSRYWGTISGSLIVGRAFAVVWPLSQVKGL